MNPIPQTIPEPLRTFPEDRKPEDYKPPEPSIPYGWEDTKDWSWR
jgi:hypothetical protein